MSPYVNHTAVYYLLVNIHTKQFHTASVFRTYRRRFNVNVTVYVLYKKQKIIFGFSLKTDP